MATVIGTILLPDGNPYVGPIKFHRLDAPAVVAGAVITGLWDGLTVQTGPTGSFTTPLKAGVYKVQIAGAEAKKIHLYDDDLVYNLKTTGVPGFPFYAGTGEGGVITQAIDFALQGVDDLRAQTQHAPNQVRYLSYLEFEGDGQGGEFEYKALSMEDDDSVLVIRPDNVAPSAPGRWHASNNPT